MTNFEYEDWALLYKAVTAEAAYWWNLGEKTDPDYEPEIWLAAKQHSDALTELRDKIEKMANERFPTIGTVQ